MPELFVVAKHITAGVEWDSHEYVRAASPREAVMKCSPWMRGAVEYSVFNCAEDWARNRPRIFGKVVSEAVALGGKQS